MKLRLDPTAIFAQARRQHFSHIELFGEKSSLDRVQFSDRILRAQNTHWEGAALRASCGVPIFRTVPSLATEDMLEILGKKHVDRPSAPAKESTHYRTPPAWFTQVQRAMQEPWSRHKKLHAFRFTLEVQNRHFWVARDENNVSMNMEVQAIARWQGWVGDSERQHFFQEMACNHSVEKLMGQLFTHGEAAKSIERAIQRLDAVPAPCGDLPVVWSEKAVAKLSLPFVRSFEGDLVVHKLSLLNDMKWPTPLPFTLKEKSPLSIDHEGNTPSPTTFWNSDRPVEIACDGRVAKALGASPGQARRPSYTTPPTVGLWATELTPHSSSGELLPQIPKGIYVRDIDVWEADPTSRKVRFQVTDANIIRDGQPSEIVAPFVMTGDLIELLQGFDSFSNTSETIGFEVEKKGYHWVTEHRAPSALSASVPIPGSVSPTHYW